MKNKFIFGLLSLASASAFAQDSSNISAGFSQSISSKYVWRGIAFNEDTVNQGDLSVSVDTDAGTFGAAAWYNLDTTDENGYEFETTELDLVLSWDKSFDSLSVGAGLINYQFPNLGGNSDTTEIYASLGLDTTLAPSITVYYDIDDADGLYFDLGIGHSFEIGKFETPLDLGATLGFADSNQSEFYYGADDAGFTNMSVAASMTFSLTENLEFTPALTVTSLLGDAADANTGSGTDVNVFTSFSFAYSF